MKTGPPKQGLTENSASLGSVTPQMVRERAVINVRSAPDVLKNSDREKAKREFAAEPDPDREVAVLESAPKSP